MSKRACKAGERRADVHVACGEERESGAPRAESGTIIDRVYHVDRGSDHIEEKLRAVGSEIRLVAEIFPKRRGATG
jgi:hypothetical protein